MTRLLDQPSGYIPAPRRPDWFPYGYRYIRRTLPDGTEVVEQVELTAEDVLHPQEGDEILERVFQEQERGYLACVFRYKMAGRSDVLITADCAIDWGVAGIAPVAPDVCAFDRVREPHLNYTTFPVVDQGARTLLVIELVSPRDRDPKSRDNDVVTKLDYYRRFGVPIYLIVDQEREDGPRSLILYHLTADGYVEEPADDEGRVLLDPVRVLVGLRDGHVVCFDADTGEEIPEYAGLGLARDAAEKQARKEAKARKAAEKREREQAEARKVAEEKQRLEAEARKAAEERQRQETEARKAAEEQRRWEAEARKAAEERQRQEAEAHKATEKRLRAEAKARKASEDRIRALEAELRRLRGTSPDNGTTA